MKFVRFEHEGTSSVGLLEDHQVRDLNQHPHRGRPRLGDVRDILWLSSSELQAHVDAARAAATVRSLEDVTVLPPVARPSKVIGVGMNYRSFARQLGVVPSDDLHVFHKTSSALVGHRGLVERPAHVRELVAEGEVAIIMGRFCRRVSPDVAARSIGALCCANDISARDLEFRTSQWTAGKMLPTSCPLGPVAVTYDEVDYSRGLELRTIINGTTVQAGNTSDMIFGFADLVSKLSFLVDLEVGDVVLSGTPSDLGELEPPVIMQDGDVVEVEVEGLGKLGNTVRAVGEV